MQHSTKKDTNLELEPIEIDYTLWGNHLEIIINACVPDWFIKWFKKDGCKCDQRREWLNKKHYQYRMWRYYRAIDNYDIAKEKLRRIKQKWL